MAPAEQMVVKHALEFRAGSAKSKSWRLFGLSTVFGDWRPLSEWSF